MIASSCLAAVEGNAGALLVFQLASCHGIPTTCSFPGTPSQLSCSFLTLSIPPSSHHYLQPRIDMGVYLLNNFNKFSGNDPFWAYVKSQFRPRN